MDRREFLKYGGRSGVGLGGLYLAGSLASCVKKTDLGG